MLPILRTNLPLSPFGRTAFDRVESLFDRFFGDEGDALRPAWAWSVVPTSMWQNDNNIYVEAELPGVAEKDIDVTVRRGVLTIKADRREEEGRTYLYNGRGFGRFERSIVLPDSVDTDHVEATLSGGVLRLTLPKQADARPKKITLKSD